MSFGSAESLITFTSSSASPGKGIWSGIYFYDSSLDQSSIDHALIEYASRGVWCGSANPSITNAMLSNNLVGVFLSTSSAAIVGCTIMDSRDHGVYTEGNSSPYLANNHIVRCNNGIWLNGSYGSPTIRNNIIRTNANGITVGYCVTPTIVFNTLHNNVTGINLQASYYTSTVSSNIITSSNCGIFKSSGNCNLSTNDLWDNGANYCGLGAGATDLSVDPLYVDALIEDLRLQEGSPLLRAGQDGGEIGAFGANGSPPLLTSSYSTVPTTSGSLTQSEIWSGLIEITGNVTVPFGYVLKLEPGTILRFANNTGLYVYGRFEANGTADNPITFTSASTSPGKGIWSGIYFYDSSLDQSSIDHALIEYASRGVWCGSANPSITNAMLSNNLVGVFLSTSSAAIVGCTIMDSRDHGVYTEGNSSPYLANNHIVRCNNGIWLNGSYGSPTIRNNIIRTNANGITVGYCVTPTIVFNTLHNNVTGINLQASYYTSTVSSNIITSSNCGIFKSSGNCNLSTNDLWDNGANYCGLGAGATDLSVDPLYVDALIEDLRLQEGSPLLRAGQDGGEIGAFGGNGSPPLLTSSYSTVPTTSGSLTQSEIWSGLIEITGNVTVPFGYVLKLEPGTILRFANNTGLYVYGRFEANGTVESPITFTSASTSPGKGIWSGIYFYDSSLDQSSIDHALIEYASRGVWCGSANPSITNAMLSNNLVGVFLSTSSAAIVGCTIMDSRDHGVYTEGNSSPYLANNHIVRCNNGIWLNGSYGSPTIRNNIIRTNANGITVGYCVTPTIVFNTLHNNVTGINLQASYYTSTVSSNIITSSNCGIFKSSGNCNLSTNDLWDNGANYCGLGAGATDLSVDPLYVDALIEDLRLQEGSPLLRAGQDGGEIGAFGANGSPPLLTSSYSTVPTTSGSLTQSEIWSGLIEITGNVTVPFGYVLKLEPGTILRFANNTGLYVYGRFEANGTADESDHFHFRFNQSRQGDLERDLFL